MTLRAAHATGFAAVVLIMAALFALQPPDMTAQIVGLVLLVAVLGLPHGALDLEVAKALWPLPDRWAVIAFGAAYLGLAGATLGLWLIAPGWSLAAFLAYSACHFADDWRRDLPTIARFAAGAVVVGAPLAFRPEQSAAIFAHLAPEPAAGLAVLMGGWVGSAGVVVCAATLCLRPGGRGALLSGLELAAILAAAWFLPPLVYFVLYFCLLHAPRHFRRTVRGLSLSGGAAARAALPPTAATLLGAVIGAGVMIGWGIAADSTALSVVFITLSALTVPHMILMDRFQAVTDGPPAGARA